MGKTLIDGRYEIRGLAGSGGMADVYLAHDAVLDRSVALKLLKDHYAENEEFIERFKREARSAASLSHAHIVPIFDWGETGDGTYYIAMEYLSGGTLRDHIMSKGAWLARAAAAVVLEIAEALRAAHEQGIIHRDIKPRNILITDSGHVKVADFGIARAAEATTISDLGEILGSVKYMSPEQAMGEPVGPASDLYSLGVVLYEMLTARVPFEVEIPADVPVKHAAGELPAHPREINPGVPEDMNALVMKLLSIDPADRYGSAEELIEDLRPVRDGLAALSPSVEEATTVALKSPAASTLPAPTPGATELRRRKWSLIVAAFTVLALLGAVGGALGWNSLRDPSVASIPEILTSAPGGLSLGAEHKPSRPEESRVPGVKDSTGQEARERLAEAGFEAVPNLVGLSYPEAENALEESGFLLGGVKEAPSKTVPEGVIIKQNTPPGTTLDVGSYVYLTTSVGSPDTDNVGRRQASGVTGIGHDSSNKALSEEAAPSGADVLAVRKENESPSHLVKVIQSKFHHGVDSLLRRVRGGGKDPHRVVAQESQYRVP